jgi:peptide/nickel transport system permease protein
MTRRVLQIVLPVPAVVFGVATIVFIALRAIPGSAVEHFAAQGGGGPNQLQDIRKALGLGEPLHVQFVKYIDHLIRFDFGRSFYTGDAVSTEVVHALPATIELAVASSIIMLVIGLVGGGLAAHWRGRWLDIGLRVFGTTMFSIPWFSLGIALILIFGVKLGWLPVFGRMPPDLNYHSTTGFVLIDALITGHYEWIGPWLEHLTLPALTVGLATAGFVLRVTRASFIEVGEADFVTTARAKGLSEPKITTRHVARNASVPIVTILGLVIGSLLGGAVVTEVVFAWPGMGQLLVQAILQRDFPVAQGAAVVIALAYVVINTLTDLAYLAIDPRLRRTG